MDSSPPKPGSKAHLTDDDDDFSGEDEISDGGRRRRFCNERANQQNQPQSHQQAPRPNSRSATDPSRSDNKRPRLEHQPANAAVISAKISRYPTRQTQNIARSTIRHMPYPRVPMHHHRSHRPVPRHVMPFEPRTKPLHRHDNHHQDPPYQTRNTTTKVFKPAESRIAPHDSVIFINPKFIKKFVEKSMSMTKANDSVAASAGVAAESTSSNAFCSKAIPSTSSTPSKSHTNNSHEDLIFQTCPRESLRAAASMAVIRLVTECIQDDEKRDEKLNKLLAGRLMQHLLCTSAVVEKPSEHSQDGETDQRGQASRANLAGRHEQPQKT